MNPLILVAPVAKKPFLLYIWAMHHSLGALLSQHNDVGHEHAIYYLSRIMVGAESSYNSIEKECLALVFIIQKMRHYLMAWTIQVISKVNPLRLIMTKRSSLNGWLVKWAILLSQYEMSSCHRRPSKDKYSWPSLLINQQSVKMYKELPDEVIEAFTTQAAFDDLI